MAAPNGGTQLLAVRSPVRLLREGEHVRIQRPQIIVPRDPPIQVIAPRALLVVPGRNMIQPEPVDAVEKLAVVVGIQPVLGPTGD